MQYSLFLFLGYAYALDFQSHCDTTSIPFSTSLSYFPYTGEPVADIFVVDGMLSTTFPSFKDTSLPYKRESVRSVSSNTCMHCPYNREGPNPSAQSNGIYLQYTPMYGPCLNAQKATKVACVQHPLFRPRAFVGEYFYPDQQFWNRTNSRAVEHLYVKDDMNPSNLQESDPSLFGLGKQKIQQALENNYVMNGTVQDVAKTEQVYGRYKVGDTSTTDEGWLLWAQHFCWEACHRNAEYQKVRVRVQDYENKSPIFQFLNARDNDNNLPTLTRCHTCPLYHAAYYEPTLRNPLQMNAFAATCFPWFGAIPQLDGGKFVDNEMQTHGETTDGISFPPTSTYYASTPCPVNTYNDVCAHTIQWYTRVAQQSAQQLNQATDDQKTYASARAGCKPCPSGTSTDGKVGAWFCTPAHGRLMRNRVLLRNPRFQGEGGQLEYWSRRDRFAYDFECGYLASHCQQCASLNMGGVLPDEFNRLMILEPLLQSDVCSSGNYCPHPWRNDSMSCPSSRPWSPPGSWHIDNCTCAKTTYWNGSLCLPCLGWDSCGVGRFLRGWSTCMYTGGAKSGGICDNCTNKPLEGAVYTGPGLDYYISSGGTMGVCSFTCNSGYRMQPVGTQSTNACLQPWNCIALEPFKRDNILVYASSLTGKRDGLQVSDGAQCTASKQLSDGLSSVTSPIPVSTTCILASALCNSTHPCRVKAAATVYSNVVCDPCPALLSGTRFTNEALDQNIGSDKLCTVACIETNYYVNATTGLCQSCSLLAAQVCPPTWLIKGGGCMQDPTPFPAVLSSALCTNCTMDLQTINTDWYLDELNCIVKPCATTQAGHTYWKTPCGGRSIGELASCTRQSDCNNVTQYFTGQCTALKNGECKQCTSNNPGYYKTLNCSWSSDSGWTLCPADSYCVGTTVPVPCPVPQKSQQGAVTIYDCYCPAGMSKNNNGKCEPVRCEDATQLSLYAPGDNYRSTRYMALDEHHQSRCYNCSDSGIVFTLDAYPISSQACRCPYQQQLQLVSDTLVCESCPSTCSHCWRTGAVCMTGTCASPPFVASSSQCAVAQCSDGFTLISSAITTSATFTGSAAYLPSSALRDGWNEFLLFDMFKHLSATTTQETDTAAYQLLLFVLVTYPMRVYAALVDPDGNLASTVPPQQTAFYWCVKSANTGHQSLAMAVSQWPLVSSYTTHPVQGNLHPTNFAWVAHVLYDTQAKSVSLYTNKVSVSGYGDPVWLGGTTCNTHMDTVQLCATECQIPALQHQWVHPDGSGHAFYAAYYTSSSNVGILAVQGSTTPLIMSLQDKGLITAMAVLAYQNKPVLYVAFGSTVFLISTWTQSPQMGQELFLLSSTGATIHFLSVTWLLEPIFWSRVTRMSAMGLNYTTIETSDKDFQRTFTEVQDMPWSSRPALGPVVIPLDNQNAFLLAAHGPRIFVLREVKRCLPSSARGNRQPTYWDPVQQTCVEHSCQRKRSCTTNTHQFYNETVKACMCDKGYYADVDQVCKPCSSGYYCVNNIKSLCPSSMISTDLASSPLQCLCQHGYYSDAQNLCRPCPAGFWCPNQWNSFPCPGGVDTTRSLSTGNIYPFSCVCKGGYTGPGCVKCPPGNRCTESTTAKSTNYAIALYTHVVQDVCGLVRARLIQYYQQASAFSVYCTLVPSTDHTESRVVVVVQDVPSELSSSLTRIWTNISGSVLVATKVEPDQGAAYYQVTVNSLEPCVQGRTNNAEGTQCVCAPGYQPGNTNNCAACSPNTFKASAGSGECISCPVDTTSLVGASVCIPVSDVVRRSVEEGGSNVNVAAIAGGVVGGLVLVGCLFFLFAQYEHTPLPSHLVPSSDLPHSVPLSHSVTHAVPHPLPHSVTHAVPHSQRVSRLPH